MPLTPDDLRKWFLSRARAEELGTVAAAFSSTREEAEGAIAHALEQGAIVRCKKGRYTTPEQAGLIVCRAVYGGGILFARPVEDSIRASLDGDIRIDASGESVWPDDLVTVRLTESAPYTRGTLESVARRAHGTLSASVVVPEAEPERRRKGRAKRRPHRPPFRPGPYAVPTDPRIRDKIALEGDLLNARTGDIAVIRMLSYPHGSVQGTAVIEHVLGDSADVRVKLRAIAAAHGLGMDFTEAAAREAEQMPLSVREEDIAGRRDLRDTYLFTIDGADAQDFDDAVSLRKIGDGWELGVHIADVSHYVDLHGAIEKDAYLRTTSTYLPGLTFLMLPEALSNRLCSLMPLEDRLALSCLMRVEGGAAVDWEIVPSVIRSRARLVYSDVNRLFAGEDNAVPEAARPVLLQMNALAKSIRAAREKRGSLEFDLPEPQFDLDAKGEPTDVRARERGDAEKLIEDFMLAANECVAHFARECEIPIPYRIHELPDPDVLAELDRYLESMEIPSALAGATAPGALADVLRSVRGKLEEAAVHSAMLRAMRRAQYDAMPRGHFALAARDYCHFTSPIRRYPDLTVHRVIKSYLVGELDEKALDRWTRAMPEIARHCSEGEYAAAMCEREADDMMRARCLACHIGEYFSGRVSGCSRASLFIALENTAEGRVPVWTIGGEYEYVEEMRCLMAARTGAAIRIGDRVRVRLVDVDERACTLEFRLVPEKEDAPCL